MWKLNRTQKYFFEIIHTWVRNKGGEGGGGGTYEALAASWKKTGQPKTKRKRRQKTKTWVCLERLEKERSNWRKRGNLKKQRWVWSGNPGGTSVTVAIWSKEGPRPPPDPNGPHVHLLPPSGMAAVRGTSGIKGPMRPFFVGGVGGRSGFIQRETTPPQPVHSDKYHSGQDRFWCATSLTLDTHHMTSEWSPVKPESCRVGKEAAAGWTCSKLARRA